MIHIVDMVDMIQIVDMVDMIQIVLARMMCQGGRAARYTSRISCTALSTLSACPCPVQMRERAREREVKRRRQIAER